MLPRVFPIGQVENAAETEMGSDERSMINETKKRYRQHVFYNDSLTK